MKTSILKNKKCYCNICNKKINLFNPKIKRTDNIDICLKCAIKIGIKKSKILALQKVNYLVKETNFKNKVIKEEKTYSKINDLLDFKRSQFNFDYQYDDKLLKYAFYDISLNINKNIFNQKTYFKDLYFELMDNVVYIRSKIAVLGYLYEGTLSKYIKKVLLSKNLTNDYKFDIMISYKSNNMLKFSLGIYKIFNPEDWQISHVLKTNIVKTQSNIENIEKLKVGELVFLEDISNNYLVINKNEDKLGFIPNNLFKILKNKEQTFYVGIVEQIYRCSNGLKTLDVKLFPIKV